MPLILASTLIIFISGLVLLLTLILSLKPTAEREKSTPFECGFDLNSSVRVPFSLRFFLITIVFLIFDVEIVILLPCVSASLTSVNQSWWTVVWIFIVILIGGLYHEWNQGALYWSL